MSLTVHPGGSIPKKKADQIKIFTHCMKMIENSMVDVKRLSQKIDWIDLMEMTNECHKNILKTLKYVKDFEKELIKEEKEEKPTISLAVDNTKK